MNTRKNLIQVALGKQPADLIVKGGRLVNVNTREIYPADVAIVDNRIASVGDVDYTKGKDTKEVEAGGRFLVPGLIETHMHTESSCVTLTQLSRVLLPRGVTTVMYAHEIAYVLGLRGTEVVRDEIRAVPLKVYIQTPTEVPIYPDVETTGAEVTVQDFREMISWDESISLGECVDQHVIGLDASLLAKFDATREFRKRINGNIGDVPIITKNMNALIAAGFSDCHENFIPEHVIEKLRLGCSVMLREANVPDLAPAFKEHTFDTKACMLCIDDKLVTTLVEEGGVDNTVRVAIKNGIDPMTVIQMATINAAVHFRLDEHIGSISPGRIADIVITDSLETLDAGIVVANGQVVAREGKFLLDLPVFKYPEWTKQTMNLSKVSPEDFEINTTIDNGEADVRVIVEEGFLVSRYFETVRFPIRNGKLQVNPSDGYNIIAAVDRFTGDTNVALGILKSHNHVEKGAIGTSFAHDHHNIIVVGVDAQDIAACANALAECGGGFAAAYDGKVAALVELEIAGMISEAPYEKVVSAINHFENVIRQEMGFGLEVPLMGLNFISLCFGSNKASISNKGLVAYSPEESHIVSLVVAEHAV